MCALAATRTDSELAGMLCGTSLADFDLSFFSSSTAPQFVAQLLAQVGEARAGARALPVVAPALRLLMPAGVMLPAVLAVCSGQLCPLSAFLDSHRSNCMHSCSVL